MTIIVHMKEKKRRKKLEIRNHIGINIQDRQLKP